MLLGKLVEKQKSVSETSIGILDVFIKFFSEAQKCSYFDNFGRMWLVNELVLTFSAPIKYDKVQFNPIILSRVIGYTTYRQTDRQTDTFVKTVFSDSKRSRS